MAKGGKPNSFKTRPTKTDGLIPAKAEGCSGSIRYNSKGHLSLSKRQTWWPEKMGNHCSPFLFLSWHNRRGFYSNTLKKRGVWIAWSTFWGMSRCIGPPWSILYRFFFSQNWGGGAWPLQAPLPPSLYTCTPQLLGSTSIHVHLSKKPFKSSYANRS